MHLALGVLALQLAAVSQPAATAIANASGPQQAVFTAEPSHFAQVRLLAWQPVEEGNSEREDWRDGTSSNAKSNGLIPYSQPLAGMFVAPAAKPLPGFRPGPVRVRRSNRLWGALTLAQHSAATFDAWSTRHALTSGGAAESDPFMRPFAHSPAVYGAIQVGPVILDYVGLRMSRSQNKWLHRLWWVPQSAATAGFFFSGGHNLAHSR